ncbi:hypothetical protein ACLGL1_03970 [Peptococcus simiae]|uniref:hypothetical protein n=1 Tax=Peptococcus simiae TaxID=1643805 RepID=UPI003980A354
MSDDKYRPPTHPPSDGSAAQTDDPRDVSRALEAPAEDEAYFNDTPLDESLLDEGEAYVPADDLDDPVDPYPEETPADAPDPPEVSPVPASRRDIIADGSRPLTEKLSALADELIEAPSPLLRKDSVIIDRASTLALVEELLAYCESEGPAADDNLMDALTADGHNDETYKPLRRVKARAQVVIAEATVQADHIVNDARVLSKELLQDTEEQIKARYDEVDADIKSKLDGAQILSQQRLTEARTALTSSRQQAVNILNRYMDKAEDDYQGYWVRAEQTLQAALEQSDLVLAKVTDIFEREMDVIGKDLQTIDDILEELQMNRPR